MPEIPSAPGLLPARRRPGVFLEKAYLMFLIELFKDNAHQWRWRCKAKNGKIVADSGEGYENWQDCLTMTMRLFCDNETFNFVNLEEEKPTPLPLVSTHPTSSPMYHTYVKEETDGI